jgi:ATP-binding cassette subfamily B protein
MAASALRAFKTLLPSMRRYRTRYIAGFLALIAVDAAQMIVPASMRRAVDLIARGDFHIREVIAVSRTMILVMAGASLGRFLWRYCIHGASRLIEKEMRGKLFARLLRLSADFYRKNKIGELMSRATSDLNAVREAVGMGLVALVDGTVMATAALVIIFTQDPLVAAFAVIPLSCITLMILFFRSALEKRFLRAQETYAAMSGAVQETFAGIRVVKSFVKERWFIKKFADTNEDYRRACMDLIKLYGAFVPLIMFLSGITSLIVLVVGGRRVALGYISPGTMVALFRYFQMLVWPLMGAGFMVHMIQRGAVSLGRVNEIMDTPPAIASPPVPEAPRPGASPLVAVTDLTFSYPEEGRAALRKVSLTVEAGSTVGITGRTGSGKSTLLKTLTRTVDPPPGTVRVKGVPVEKWDLGELRACFGVAPQDSYLFSDSIGRNISYGLDNDNDNDAEENGASREAVETAEDCLRRLGEPVPPNPPVAASRAPPRTTTVRVPRRPLWSASHDAYEAVGDGPEAAAAAALETAALERDIRAFAQGLDTVIGERGLTLSGGQKQRVALARALATEPEILVLDDSLSAVDRETEGRILAGLLKARRGKTTIIVSHRVSTLTGADKVVVLERGEVAEQGTPAELRALGGFFSRMAAIQETRDTGEDDTGRLL